METCCSKFFSLSRASHIQTEYGQTEYTNSTQTPTFYGLDVALQLRPTYGQTLLCRKVIEQKSYMVKKPTGITENVRKKYSRA